MISQQQCNTSRTGKRSIQLAGSAAKGLLDLDLFFVFAFFSRNAGVVFEPIAPPGNDECLGMVQETIQDRVVWAGSDDALDDNIRSLG